MAKLFKVSYSGYYIVEADSAEEALETGRDDYEVLYDGWNNDSVVVLKEDEN